MIIYLSSRGKRKTQYILTWEEIQKKKKIFSFQYSILIKLIKKIVDQFYETQINLMLIKIE